MTQINKVGVLGAGLMGHGIAQVVAQAGYDVVLREVDEDRLAKGIGKIEKQLGKAVEKGKLAQEDADAVRARILVDQGKPADARAVLEGYEGLEDPDVIASGWYVARAEGDAAAMEEYARRYERVRQSPLRDLEDLVPVSAR